MEEHEEDGDCFDDRRMMPHHDVTKLLEPTPIGPNGVEERVLDRPSEAFLNPFHAASIKRQRLVGPETTMVMNPPVGNAATFMSSFQEGALLAPAVYPPTTPANKPRPPTMMANKNKKEPEPANDGGGAPAFLRQYQADQWTERFQDFVDFFQGCAVLAHGHCVVPHN